MKARLEFNLPDEQNEFTLANNGSNFYCALFEIDNYLRNKIKYECESLSEEELKTYEKIREEVNQIINDYASAFHEIS